MQRILITGANRGIGFGLVQEHLRVSEGILIFATCRDPQRANALQTLAHQYPDQVKILPLEVTDRASIDAAFGQITAQVDGLELLYNNAGIYPDGVFPTGSQSSSFGYLDAEAMLDVFRINTVAPAIVTQAAADLLRSGQNARVINLSSDAGSLTMHADGGNYSYPASKAALNMLTRCLAGDFRAQGVTVIALHPGWVKTDMGGERATLELDEAIPSIVRVVNGLTLANSGEFFNWDGTHVPW